ncbi:RRM domain-containing protein [Caenorhabditis elegans]|uniref:RRM domain-containing protein n=1 Tax=Caenorhabditis elegans TaxID=6239 RepID=G4SPY0_CAEEL|nr:RRM domain-containing protein [Caenorhabditis elegans]CCD68043.1 RRM domain-containing protein [Caenorhabditis elegans]|eukprot:NP_741334.3 Heterogeneous nuclear RibonucleoProtein U [Caenorhabditis elegans]
MTDETENVPKTEQEVPNDPESEKEVKEDAKEEVKDLIPEFYSQHGGDPRLIDIAASVWLSGIPTDFITDTYEQFCETIKNIMKMGHKLDVSTVSKIVRIPNLDSNAKNSEHALRALICFSDKKHIYRMMTREAEFAKEEMKVELIEELPSDALEISEDDKCLLLNGLVEAEDAGDDVDVGGGDDDEIDELMDHDDEGGHDEHEEDEESDVKKEEEKGSEKKEKKPEPPKKKVYEDEDEKAPFEMYWDGAPEFQWRLCEGPRDEKKLIIDNLLWADLNNVFIYRTIQKSTTCEINFPTRFNSDGNRTCHGKLTLFFPGNVAIMDEALKHLVYFRSGDGRRIKVFLPQTTVSLKRKEEFEGKLGRVIKPTERMMQLIVKILPDGYTPTLDEACAWFPLQAVIQCDLVNDEMGNPCAVVKFETAEEAVAAHAGKSFVTIVQKSMITVKDSEGNEKEEEKETETHCNVFMRGVEAHFGSLLTYYDQRKKVLEQRKKTASTGSQQRPQQAGGKRQAGSTIRGPAQKKRAPSPSPKRGGHKDGGGASRGNARNVGRGGGQRRSSPPPRSSPRGGGARGGPSSRGAPRGGGRGGISRSSDRPKSSPRSSSYRNDSFSSSSHHRQPARAEAFGNYGYGQFENRYNSSNVDPFGRPVYGNSAFNSSSSSSSFHRGDDRSGFFERRRY